MDTFWDAQCRILFSGHSDLDPWPKLLEKSCPEHIFYVILFVGFESLRPSTIFQLCRDGSSWVEPVLS